MSSLATLENPNVITLPHNWKPRQDQMPLWGYLENGGKRAVEVAHRRWGKDDIALHYTATAAHERIGNYWHMLPKYEQARKAIWDAINPKTGKRRIDEAFPLHVRKKTNQQSMLIEFKCGSIWQLVGSDNYNSLVGSPPIGVVFSEWALADPRAWGYIRPILLENGGWALFIYTMRGSNHGKTLYDFAKNEHGWFAEKRTAAQSPVFTPEQLEQERREMIAELKDEAAGEALFQQEYFCSSEGALLGAYYGKQMTQARKDGRITSVPWIPSLEVYTFWDLGIDDSMTIWFVQPQGKSFRVIDYYENSGFGLEHYAKELKSKPYVYAEHFMPHDANEREMTNSEIAKTRKEVAEELGMKPITVVSRARNIDIVVNVHIPAVRNLISQCWFDEKKCGPGIDALESYHTEYDNERRKLGNRPEHDWSSHGADAFRTFAVGYSPEVADKPVTEIMAGMSFDGEWAGG